MIDQTDEPQTKHTASDAFGTVLSYQTPEQSVAYANKLLQDAQKARNANIEANAPKASLQETTILQPPKKRTRKCRWPYKQRLEAVMKWYNRKDDLELSLDEFLEQEFGNEAGYGIPAGPTLYSWKYKFEKDGVKIFVNSS